MVARSDLGRVRVETRKLSDLVPADYNPRKISDDALSGLGESIGRFGLVQPIIVNARTGRVVGGHQRLKVLEAQGVEATDVVVVDLAETEEKALNLALNSQVISGEWTEAALAVIEQVARELPDLSEALRMSDLDEAIRGMFPATAAPVVEDEVPEPPDDPVTKPGDLWVLGDHRLLCGDSGSAEDLDRLLAGVPIHLLNTDPPYNVKVEPRSNNAIRAGLSSFSAPEKRHHQALDLARHPGKSKPTHKKMRAKDRPLTNDFVTDEEFEKLLRAWFGNASRVMLPGRAAYIWGGYANVANYPPALKEAGLYFSQTIIWDKQHPVLTRKDFMGAHEWCFYSWKEGAAPPRWPTCPICARTDRVRTRRLPRVRGRRRREGDAVKIDASTPLWCVTDPAGPDSTLPDVCFETTLDGLRLQFAGGLSMDQRPVLWTSQEEAHEDAKTRLFIWRVARQIRIDRRLPEDEVVRVTLHDRDGRVLFEGEVG